MSTDDCLAELTARHVEHVRVGLLSGVRFRTLLTKSARERSPYEIIDCRLALAIDIAFFGRANGSAYSILRDERLTRTLARDVVCDAVAEGIFHVALTPDYDVAHRDHFHLEILPEATSSFAR